MSNFPNLGTVYLEGNPVKQVSLLTGNSTPQNAPKVINGAEREQIILCDPLTGAPLDLQAGGGGGTGTVKSINTITPDGGGNVTLAAGDVGALGQPVAWAAGTNTPHLTSGTAVLGSSFVNTTPGTTALSPNIDGIASVNEGDELVCLVAGTYTLSPALDTAGRVAAAQFPILAGDVTTPGSSLTTTLNPAAPTLSQQITNAQTGTAYTLVLADAGKNVDMNNASANTLTIPPHSAVPFPVGTVVTVTMAGAGVTTIAAGAGVTLVKPAADSYSISAQYRTAMLYQVSQDTWRVLAN